MKLLEFYKMVTYLSCIVLLIFFLTYYLAKLALLISIFVIENNSTLKIFAGFSTFQTAVLIGLIVWQITMRFITKEGYKFEEFFSGDIIGILLFIWPGSIAIALADIPYAGYGFANLIINTNLNPILMASYIMTIIVSIPGMIGVALGALLVATKFIVLTFTCCFCCGRCLED